MYKLILLFVLPASCLSVLACGSDTAAPETPDPAVLLTVTPQGGAVGVPTGQTITLTFDHPMGEGMEAYLALHDGGDCGPVMDAQGMFSSDRMTLTLTPAHHLEPGHTYSIHLGGGMTDDHGHVMDMEQHGPGMGGQWATESMMNGGMGNGNGMGNGGNPEHMGEGWRHHNGTYGMLFTFTTAS